MVLELKKMMPFNFLNSHPYNLPSQMDSESSCQRSIPFHQIFTSEWTNVYFLLNLHQFPGVNTWPNLPTNLNNILHFSHTVETSVIDHPLTILIRKCSKGVPFVIPMTNSFTITHNIVKKAFSLIPKLKNTSPSP